ncbi:MAG TPA: citrate synthase [Fibrobacteres bacterium]|jgi:citrate synthase|nr:citrate synthase [Fibrobacterota bacterium]
MSGGEEVLFSITRAHLDTGMRGFPVGTCPLSDVDPVKGLSYGGYPIAQLAERQPEEVIYLLLNKQLPDAAQLAAFRQELIKNSRLHPEMLEKLSALPRHGHPMKWLMSAIVLMGMYSGTGDYRKDCLQVIAQLPEAVAAIFRIRSGWGELIPSKPELGYMENFAHMLGAPGAGPELIHLLRVFNILHMDHGGGNLSTFVGKAIASGHEDMYGSLAGAMAGLAGPLHGMANQECLRFLKTVAKDIKDPSNETQVAEYVENLLNSGGVLYGFGHAVLRVEDPRATVQYALGEKIAAKDPLFRLAVTLRKVGSEALKKRGKVSDPYPNVDAVSGCLLSACGLADESYYTVLFGLARCVGIAAQIAWERTEARGGKGTPIVRPSYLYTGPEIKA